MTDDASKNTVTLAQEADFFSAQDNRRQRQAAWTALPGMQERIRSTLDVDAIAAHHLEPYQDKRGLTLACGDMTGPYGCFKQCGIKHIDAWDISEGQREKFYKYKYDGSMAVDYRIGDVNTLELPENHYDLVVIQQAYHHFSDLEHITLQIRQALKPHGLLVLKDYIGPNFLQRSMRQLAVCRDIWRDMPARYRTDMAGHVCDDLHIPDKDSLPPFEAVRAEDIMAILQLHLVTVHLHRYAAILFPLFNGFAQNYTDSAEDLAFIERMWLLDRQLIADDAVEANFVRGIFMKPV